MTWGAKSGGHVVIVDEVIKDSTGKVTGAWVYEQTVNKGIDTKRTK